MIPLDRKGNLYKSEIRKLARKHGITTDEIRHAPDHALRLIEFEYDGEDRLLVIGDNGHGTLLELVLVPAADPGRVIHADRLRPSLFEYLR
ncbi:unannotated protein [freshwater metagenome]|uniref:Unannotated protein n=1 Tax=freshwater metagenome TaxID=449393 RepID=A0A6J7PAJ4_9ZZZZ